MKRKILYINSLLPWQPVLLALRKRPVLFFFSVLELYISSLADTKIQYEGELIHFIRIRHRIKLD